MSNGVRGKAFAAIAGVLALLAAGAALAVVVTAGAAPLGSLDDTTVPITTAPAPDPAPAPAPKPKPKPTPKPAPKKVASTPAPSYTAPARTYSAPTYTPPRSTTTKRTKRQVTRKHKKVSKPAPVTTSTPKLTTPAVIVPVPVGARRAITHTNGDAIVTSILFIGGVSFAAFLFLLAAALPGTPARFTPVGRVVIDHQQDLVLVGLAAFVITIFVYVLTGHGL